MRNMNLEQLMTNIGQLKAQDQLRAQIEQQVASLQPSEIVDLIIGGGLVSAAAPITAPAPAAPVSNVTRAASGRRSMQIIDGRPSLPWGMRIILKEAGHSMHGDDIFNALAAYGWLPKGKKPRQRVAQALSQQSEVFLRDKKAGRGFYYLASTDVPELPPSVKRAKAAPAITRPVGSKGSAATSAAPVKKPTHKPLAERKETMGPALKFLLANKRMSVVASTDVAKALKIEANEMQGPLIALMKSGALKKTAKTNDDGKTLYKVNYDKLVAHAKGFEEKTGTKVMPVKTAAKPSSKKSTKKASKKVAKAAPKKAEKSEKKAAAPKPAPEKESKKVSAKKNGDTAKPAEAPATAAS